MFKKNSRFILVVLAVFFVSNICFADSTSSDEGIASISISITKTASDSAEVYLGDFTQALTPPTMSSLVSRSAFSTTAMSVSPASLASNNLALQAHATASSHWPWASGNRSFVPTPDKGNNGNYLDDWVSRFWIRNSWYRLDWTSPVNTSRIFVTHATTSEYNAVQTISSIKYWDLGSSQWVTIPGSTFTYGGSQAAASIDFEFPEITTNAILLSMYTNSHPNYLVFINEIEVYGEESCEVTSVAAIPNTLWIGRDAAGSGVVFRATTTDEATVEFKVVSPSGLETVIGSSSTENQLAKLSWWGMPAMEEGDYTVVASVDNSNKSSTFTVKIVDVNLTGLGKWMKNTKDPAAFLPPSAAAEVCPLNSWEEMLSLPEGYFSSIAVGDPVSIPSGNLNLPEVDLTLKDRRTFAVARIYNSLDQKVGAFGRGWSSPLLVNLAISNDYVFFTNSDGSKVLFNKENGSFTPAAPTDLKLVYNSDTEFYTLSHPTGTNWIFNSNGQILQMLRACCGQGASDAIVFTYDASDKLSSVATPSGKSISFTFNVEGLITSITDSTDRTFTYSYDESKNLVSYKDPLNRETTYNYDESGFLTAYTKPGNKMTEIIYVDNRVILI
jgi:YD repeat-containing protein